MLAWLVRVCKEEELALEACRLAFLVVVVACMTA